MKAVNHLPLRLLSAFFALRFGDTVSRRLFDDAGGDSLSGWVFELLAIDGLAEWLYGWVWAFGTGPNARIFLELGWCFFGPFAVGVSGTIARKQGGDDGFGSMLGRELGIALVVGLLWAVILPIWPLVAYVYLFSYSDPSRVPDRSVVDAQGITEVHVESWIVVLMIIVSAVLSAVWSAF